MHLISSQFSDFYLFTYIACINMSSHLTSYLVLIIRIEGKHCPLPYYCSFLLQLPIASQRLTKLWRYPVF